MNRVKAGIFSLTPPTAPDDDGSYFRWHLLDHMPEQFQLPGIVQALRYTADDAHRQARIAGEGPLADTGNLMHYLVGDPVEQTLDDWLQLGARLAELGRFPHRRTSLRMAATAVLDAKASARVLVGGEVLPWRPHAGVVLVVEEPCGDGLDTWLQWLHTDHVPGLLRVPGVAGVWTYGSTQSWRTHPAYDTSPQHVTVVYLDDDPLAAVPALTPLLQQRWASGAVRPLFAGPLRSMLRYDVL